MNGKRGSVPYARDMVINTSPTDNCHTREHVI